LIDDWLNNDLLISIEPPINFLVLTFN